MIPAPVALQNLMPAVPAAVPYGYDPVLHNDPAILEDLLQTQDCYAPDPLYCPAVQTTIQFYMRRTVVQWVLDVCREIQFMEGFGNTVQLLDRYLSKNEAKPGELQLFAAACLFITSKIKAVQSIPPNCMVDYTDNSITAQDLLLVELLVAKTLDWDLVGVTVYDVTFSLVRFLQRDHVICDLEAKFLLDYAEPYLAAFLLDHESLQYHVSHLAAAALHYLAWLVLNWGQHQLHSLELHLLQLIGVKPHSQSWQASKSFSRQCLENFIAGQQQEEDHQQQKADALC